MREEAFIALVGKKILEHHWILMEVDFAAESARV
jgi:hypothetical protein